MSHEPEEPQRTGVDSERMPQPRPDLVAREDIDLRWHARDRRPDRITTADLAVPALRLELDRQIKGRDREEVDHWDRPALEAVGRDQPGPFAGVVHTAGLPEVVEEPVTGHVED